MVQENICSSTHDTKQQLQLRQAIPKIDKPFRNWPVGIWRHLSGFKGLFIKPVESRDARTLLGVIKCQIEDGTMLHCDCWKMYDYLEQDGQQHLTDNYRVNCVNPDIGVHTQHIERVWRNLSKAFPKFGRQKANWPFFSWIFIIYYYTVTKQTIPLVQNDFPINSISAPST